MFISMIIKEIKLFVRSKGSLLMMFAFPIILITILGFALDAMMSGDANFFNDSKVIYEIQGSTYADGFNNFKDTMENQFEGLTFEKSTNSEESQNLVSDNKALCFITIDDNGYTYFRNEKGEPQSSKIFRSIFEGVIDKYSLIDVVVKNDPSIINSITKEESEKYTKDIAVGNRPVTSIDYYTFAELALIILYVSSIVGDSVVKEKELGTSNRVALTDVSYLKLIVSKILFGVIIAATQIVVIYFYSTWILDAQWGDKVFPMIFNLMSLGVFASVLGAVVGMTLKDGKSLNGVLNVIIVIICLFGGCYTPLSMIKSIPVLGDLAVISPIYWINSSLISLSTGVKDIYSSTALIMTLGLSVVLVTLYIIYTKLKGRGKLV